ncbi:hypothetical protein KC352_g26620, partial [Hortaea werneckii]
PQELRDEITAYLVLKPRDTVITMLSNHACHRSEVSAAQPNLARVNHQLRREILPQFYRSNHFLAEVSDPEDLATAKRWLDAIGDENAGCLWLEPSKTGDEQHPYWGDAEVQVYGCCAKASA